MVRVSNIGRLGQVLPSVNATFGEDGASSGSFVPSLGRLGALGAVRLGSKGPQVETLQQLLVDEGYVVEVDGIFGASTQSALIEYQRAAAIPPTGVADDATMNALLGLTVTPTADAIPTPANLNAPWPWPKKYNVPILVGGIGIAALGVGLYFVSKER